MELTNAFFGAPSSGRFTFTITSGKVTGMAAVFGSSSRAIALPSNATFAVGTGTVTETLTSTGGAEVIKYATAAGSTTQYLVAQETHTIATPTTANGHGGTSGVSFTIANGAVAGMSQTSTMGAHTSTHAVSLVPAMTFTVASGSVTETVVQGNVVEATKYVQPTAGGLYAVASETTTYIPVGTATTALSVNEADRAKFTIASGAVTAVQHVGASGAAITVTPDSHTTFKALATGFVEEIHTFGGHSSYEVFYTGASAGGVYTEVAHGSGTTVDLVGLQAQLAQIPTAIAALL